MVIGTIVTVLFISVRQSQRVRDTAEGVTKTQEILNHLRELELAIVDNETASRGYVITHQQSFLQSLGESEKHLQDEFGALSSGIKDLQSDNHLIDSIGFYVNSRVSFSREMVASRDAEGIDGAVTLVTAGTGKFYTNKVRQFSEQLQQHQELAAPRSQDSGKAPVAGQQQCRKCTPEEEKECMKVGCGSWLYLHC